ncbi:MAG: Rieske 2Fe-2S domain-containing protein [SAR324 cluster bacterium]|nr:Rieske 2Fe-2S domain-containing protein [SAR324 cluster bacterium]
MIFKTTSALFSRKNFLKVTALLISAYPVKLFYDVSKTSSSHLSKPRQQILPMDLPEGISFHGKIIASLKQDEIVFFSADCPHLGCTINRHENGRLICPCHGSRFSLEGKVLDGPAMEDLPLLSFVSNSDKRQYTVLLPT